MCLLYQPSEQYIYKVVILAKQALEIVGATVEAEGLYRPWIMVMHLTDLQPSGVEPGQSFQLLLP